ncbi:DUF1667 domain-containing protein [Alkalibacter rhizosphaerae]|uniref:DUF1667 domain-containing protein n=1 Tax=Alkalibacter rhizosphaerae TaxID=2815577 RepID=UPI0035A949BE
MCGSGDQRSPTKHRHFRFGERGELPLASVRLTAPIPKDRIFDVMEAIKALTCTAPLRAGEVLIQDILGLGADVICTKEVDRIQQ